MATTAKKKTSLARAVFSGSLGNMLEWFDYGLYGYFAVIISRDFFVSDDPIVGLLLSFLVFGTGFLVRPIGGILIGAYADKHGRIKALTLTIMCMGICTMCMGLLPTYSQVGIAAPILLTVLRLLQGLATGGEFGSSLTFIAEYGTPNNRAFLVSWQPFSVGCGLLVGSAAGLLITTVLPEAALYDWGWRIPFICGILIAIYGVHMRKNVPDSPEFLKMKEETNEAEEPHTPVKDLFLLYKKPILTVMGLLVGSSATYYLLITYMPTYISQFMHTSLSSAFVVNTSVIAINLLLCPIVGKLIDKVGRRKCLIIGCLGFLILSYPVFALLIQQTDAVVMIALLGVLIVFQTILAVAIAVVSAEVFPTKLRNSGIGFSYNLAAAIFGGLAPLAATALIAATGNQLSITYLILGSILITFLTTVFLLKGFYAKGK
ncbi:MFS transporter [Eggerthella sinensis]|jgi:MFS transporter, MHS family, proline/betaine transporter|uniref:Putative proline/betaine transporter n=1 Tax=Eggerthella sinensis TaxID=242230 RepID=A0A3N0J0U6_9ACTN|nr:MFS transporter [Eggerthella sinensis]MCB7036368.1 MFS transporter [Eggerthella sinensis]RDB71889.1 MFS transporter [Eggerthella sinensis]RNM42814.1 MFS transporter [Eggerthella sinensis]